MSLNVVLCVRRAGAGVYLEVSRITVFGGESSWRQRASVAVAYIGELRQLTKNWLPMLNGSIYSDGTRTLDTVHNNRRI